MFKKFLLFFISLFLLLFSFSAAKAEGEFLIDSTVEYKVLTTGITQVTHAITLENVLSNIYATTYKLKLENIKADNLRAYDDKGRLDSQTETQGDSLIIKVNFTDPMVGKGNKRQFNVAYDVSRLAQKRGRFGKYPLPD